MASLRGLVTFYGLRREAPLFAEQRGATPLWLRRFIPGPNVDSRFERVLPDRSPSGVRKQSGVGANRSAPAVHRRRAATLAVTTRRLRRCGFSWPGNLCGLVTFYGLRREAPLFAEQRGATPLWLRRFIPGPNVDSRFERVLPDRSPSGVRKQSGVGANRSATAVHRRHAAMLAVATRRLRRCGFSWPGNLCGLVTFYGLRREAPLFAE
jgi:hypothetical protein